MWGERRINSLGFPVRQLADTGQRFKMYLAIDRKRSGQEHITSNVDVDVS